MTAHCGLVLAQKKVTLDRRVEIFNNSAMTTMTPIAHFNQLDIASAQKLMWQCCASARWCERMVASRPYHSITQLSDAADAHWQKMEQHDFLEAFRGHPKIGNSKSAGDRHGADHKDEHASTRAMATAEQSGAASASERVRASLTKHNHDYEKKFGFIFIVCASGKSAEEMLDLLQARLNNTYEQEIANAAEEQRKITQLRIGKVFAEEG